MEIVTKETVAVDWYKTLIKLKPGKSIRIDYEERGRARYAISTEIKKLNPEMQFFTKSLSDKNGKYLLAIRLE